MESFEPKKLLILRILEILTEYSNSEHKLRQGDIMNLLRLNYGIECERKAVARNVEYLQDAGYDIVSDKSGTYLAERKFEIGELRLLIDSVLANRNVCKPHTKELVAKLAKEGGKYFKNYTKHVINLDDWQKQESKEYFYNIELLCEAIEKKRQVAFYYNSYGLDKNLHHRSGEKRIVNPYQLLLKNGFYYLICNYDKHENGVYCRIDRISEIEILELPVKPYMQVQGFENGLNIGRISNKLPYMFDDKAEEIVFESRNSADDMINNVIDWFGNGVKMERTDEGNIRFSVYASPRAMRFWILQFGRYVKVLKPQSLCTIIKEDIAEMQKLYEE